ncbi:ComEC family competence protein [Candidatus Parcubacteria bacterium]|nr:ComEC family competence protein [Candidatus Parcubacteria bacterium]
MKNRAFYGFSLSFFAGVFAASFISFPRLIFVFAVPVLLTGIFFARKKPLVLFCFGAAMSFSLGALRLQVSEHNDHPLDRYIGKKASIAGVICAEPEKKGPVERFCFDPDEGEDRIIASVGASGRFAYGDALTLAGTLKLPESFQTYEGGPEFDYVSYLGKDGIRYTMSYARAKKTGEGKGNPIVALLISFKSAFMGRVRTLLPEPHASLAAGLILGEKASLPEQVIDDFKRSGLTHVLVLSGSNVTVVAESLLRAFSFLPRAVGQSLGALSIVLFALMTGASATTVRATFMALVMLLARGIGRRYDVVRALVAAAFIMLLENPRILAFDISFQLSFLATIAVIYVSPLVKDRLPFVSERFGMREILSMTISTQIFTLPFILYKMGEISVIALAPNLLVLPAVPYAMLGGFATGAVGFVSPVAAWPIAWITRLVLSYMLETTAFFAAFPFATMKASFGAPLAALSYAAYALIIRKLWRRRKDSPPSAN